MTKRNFIQNEKYLKDGCRLANWDEASGGAPEAIAKAVMRILDENPEDSPAMKRAKTLSYLLMHSQIEIDPETCFSSKLNLGCSYDGQFVGSFAYERIFGYRAGKSLESKLPEIVAKRKQSEKMGISIPGLDFGHICPDWSSVIGLGLKGLLQRVRACAADRRKKGMITPEEADFYRAVELCYQAIFAYMDRLIKAGEKKGVDDFVRCMKNLKENPPATLYEAMQLSLLFLEVVEIGMERARTLGNIDELYYPFYKRDMENGLITKEEAKDLFRYFLVKIYSAKRVANQPICIGGTDKSGCSRVSEMTYLFLEIYEELKITNPKLHICCNEETPKKLLDLLFRMIRSGNSSIVFINEEQIMRAYEKIGIGREVSSAYLPIGCYEPVIQGKEDARICASWINLAKGVEFTIHGGYDALSGELFFAETNPEPETFDEFMNIVRFHLKTFVVFTKDAILQFQNHASEIYASPLYSSTFLHCIEEGKDVFAGGAEIKNTSLKVFAVGTAVDSLLMVKKYVYEEKELFLRQLSRILKANWAGFESLRARVQHDRIKWGCGIKEADDLAKGLYDYMSGLIAGTSNGYGGVYRLGCDSVDMSRIYAVGTGASADGRLAGMPLTRNLRPNNGMERNGVTGFIRSVCSLDFTSFCDGAPIDILLHPSAVQGEKGIDMMEVLLKVYFEKGGSAFQGNVLDPTVLEKAQQNPEDYQDLQVRVCGWNEYFVNMDKDVQNDFIARAKGEV